MEMTIADEPERNRYEGHNEDGLVGHVDYEYLGDQLVLVHTETDSRYQGQGVGSSLVRGALNDIRARGITVVPRCGFVRSWVKRHPEYADVIDEESRAEILG